MNDAILRVSDLKTHFPVQKGLMRRIVGYVRAVDGITFDVAKGETLGVVGESGCGKSTMLRSILGLVRPTSGIVEFEGRNLTHLRASALRSVRDKVQMVFQDPYASLDPHYTIASTLLEPLETRKLYSRAGRQERVKELLELVGLNPDDADKYPHEFSGGQRQRIGIARALACNPELLLLDEPVAALDVSVQAQVLNLLEDLQSDLQLTYVFVAHDLSVVRYLSTRVLVLKHGRMVEMAETEELFRNPLHAYTRELLAAVPIPDPDVEQVWQDASETAFSAAQGNDVQDANPERDPMQVWKQVSPTHFVAV